MPELPIQYDFECKDCGTLAWTTRKTLFCPKCHKLMTEVKEKQTELKPNERL